MIENIKTLFCHTKGKILSFGKKKQNVYSDLAPVDESKGKSETIDALRWAIKNPRVTNIALTGPYGAGKSSVINAYLKKYHKFRWRRKKTVLRLSLATFDDKIKDDENSLEKGILKQLFYKVNARRIPQSRYRKLHATSLFSYILRTMLLFVLATCCIYLFKKNVFNDYVDYIFNVNQMERNLNIVAWVILILGISCIMKHFASKLSLKEISFGEFNAKTDEIEQESVFDKNIDEILYFFEKTSYSIVIIEDLDRFDNTEVFIRLRELNTLINNSDAIGQRVKFIYAVKDELFKDETERTKFFDFIIPVIPVINKTNSGQKLIELLHMNDENIDENLATDITPDFITNIAPYISDMRILRNIVNEFWIFKRTLKDEKDVNLKDYKMFAIIMYKNIYPEDFALLESESGLVKNAFNNKNNAIYALKTALKKKIDVVSKRQNDYVISSERELKILILDQLSNGHEINYINTSEQGNISKNELLSDDVDFTNLFEQSFTVYPRHENSIPYRNGKDSLNENVKTLFERYEAFHITRDKNAEDLKKECEQIEQEIIKLQSMTLSELIVKLGKKDALPEAVVENNLLTFLLRNGYIDESYGQYINYFYPGSITELELNYILSVRNFDGVDNKAFIVEHPANVIKRMFDYEFKQTESLNYSLTDYLLSMDGNEKYLDCLISQVVNRSENSKRFISEYLNRNIQIGLFVQCICGASQHIWEDIENDTFISDERRLVYFRHLIQFAEINDIEKNNYDCLARESNNDVSGEQVLGISRFFTMKKERLSELSTIPDNRVIEVIDKLQVFFFETELDDVSDGIFNHIVHYCCYELNIFMLLQICNRISSEKSTDLMKKNYSCLREIGNQDILEYIEENTSEYIGNVVLLEENVDETKDSIVELLNNVKNNVKVASQLIAHEKNAFWDVLDECVDIYDNEPKLSIWNFVLENQKVAVTWNNVATYIMTFELTKELLQFMELNLEELFRSELTSNMTPDMRLGIMTSEISEQFFSLLLKLPRIDISELGSNFSIRKIQLMIESDYLIFSPEIHDEIMEKDDELGITFGLRNQTELLEHISECSITNEIIKKYIQSEKLEEKHLLKILDMISEDDLDEETALKLRNCRFILPKQFVSTAFNTLNECDRYELMYNQLEVFELDELPDLFSKLSDAYKDFTYREKQHKFTLFDTEYNEKLCEKLEKVNFLTSSHVEENKHFDPVLGKEIVDKRIVGNVKKAR